MAAERVHVFLLLRSGGKSQRIVVWDTQDVSVGRAAGNDVVVEDPEMSRNHACFRKDEARFLVDNLSTSNPTLVNGELVSSQSLESKDVVRIGETELVFYRVVQNPLKLGIPTEYASQLKGFGAPAASGDGEATILGLMDTVEGDDDDFQVRPAGDFDHDLAGMDVPSPRNLDLEIGDDGLDELDITPRPSAEAWTLDEGEAAARGCVSITVELEGLSPDQAGALRALLGKTFDLQGLRVRLKGADLD